LARPARRSIGGKTLEEEYSERLHARVLKLNEHDNME